MLLSRHSLTVTMEQTMQDTEALDLISDWCPLILLDQDWKILWCSAAMRAVAGGLERGKFVGVNFDEVDLVFKERRTFLVRKIMKPIADEYGHATAWNWMKSPNTGQLFRILVTLRLLPRNQYGLAFMHVEDQTARTFTKQLGAFFYDVSGSKFTEWELQLVDLFIGGMTYDQLAESLDTSPPIVRRRLNKLARQANCESPAEFREKFWGRHAEEAIPSTASIVPGFAYAPDPKL